MNALLPRLLGLAIATALGAALWALWAYWGAISRLDQWTGIESLRVLRPWLTELKLPILVVLGTLLLTVANRVVERFRIGH
ncbi:MAG: hypothetical protein ACFBRM_06270 [Pikeienuella sp.]